MSSTTQSLPRLVGQSARMEVLRQDIHSAARSDAKVLITGESGSGKEIVAQLIHGASRRKYGPMMTINCAAMAESLLETELFGHARGSFTGAYRDRTGIFEAAHRGTVLLDEIGETSPRMQGMLLRFLETGEVQRVGADRHGIRVDVRVIAATHRVLLDAVAAKAFREDLYYRLNIIHVHVPPLREHVEDIPELIAHWLEQFRDDEGREAVLSRDAIEWLCRYHWPGNVRELRNVVERLVSRELTRVITAADLPPEITAARFTQPHATRLAASAADALFSRIVNGRESFWTVVYEPFILRDLTRDDLRAIISRGLARTSGNYRLLVELFNMPPRDYKRFLTFLHKHECHIAFQPFRSAGPLRMSEHGKRHEDPPHEASA